MDFNTLVDQTVICTATVSKVITKDRNGNGRILFEYVYINNEYFRCHAWALMSKRLSRLISGDRVSFDAKLIEYASCDNVEKFGLKSLRNVVVESNF